MLENGRVTTFTIPESLDESQQGEWGGVEGGGTIPHTQIKVNIYS